MLTCAAVCATCHALVHAGLLRVSGVAGENLSWSPISCPDSLTRKDTSLILFFGAEVCAPGPIARAGGFGQLLAVRVRALQAAQIRPVARAHARDEEAHLRILRRRPYGSS